MAFGPAALGTIDHETQVGLYLNRERATLRRSHEIAVALGAMAGGLTREWFSALHDDDETAETEYQRYAAHRELDGLDMEP